MSKSMQTVVLILVCVMMSGAIVWASKSGAQDRSYLVYQVETQKYVSVTEKTVCDKFPIAPLGSKCDIMGVCVVDGKTMLDSEKCEVK